jgi:hypothetical protein
MGPISIRTRKHLGADANWNNVSTSWRLVSMLRLSRAGSKLGATGQHLMDSVDNVNGSMILFAGSIHAGPSAIPRNRGTCEKAAWRD